MNLALFYKPSNWLQRRLEVHSARAMWMRTSPAGGAPSAAILGHVRVWLLPVIDRSTHFRRRKHKHPFSLCTRLLAPRRLQAKETPRTQLISVVNHEEFFKEYYHIAARTSISYLMNCDQSRTLEGSWRACLRLKHLPKNLFYRFKRIWVIQRNPQFGDLFFQRWANYMSFDWC